MSGPLNEVCCASLPPEALGALAPVRDLPGVSAAQAAGRAWVRWEVGELAVLRAVLPVAGVELFLRREGRWYRFGQHLPAFDFPVHAEFVPLPMRLTPAPVRPLPPRTLRSRPVGVTVAADHHPRPATALRCALPELARWADTVPSGRLAMLQAGQCNDRVLLRGGRLPPLAGAERFWGDTVLVPLGCRPEPDLAPRVIRQALGIAAEDLLLLTAVGAEVVPTAALRPLTRAQIRLALEEATP